jgi:hypothetical protein
MVTAELAPSEFTRAEIEAVRAHVRDRWPRGSRYELRRLPLREQRVVAALCLLDAFPVDGVTGEHERERCELCGCDRFAMRRSERGWSCAFTPACSYRARLRLGIPRWQALELLEREKATRRARWTS